ncbi:MAG TPA: response regulator transcription factor [Aggregatilineales bacterium]|jgi:DNA-binding NarL/FixJ family response regulator|nr:response regulator transcription factor [Aggregatilineales bacterium]
MVRIILADDHKIVREGIQRLLEEEAGLQVVATAADGLETVRLVDAQPPDVLIVDLMMPGINGLEVTRQVAQRYPQVRIIILSMHADEAYVIEVLRSGAMGYVLKESGHVDLMAAIREVQAGRRYLSAPLSERAIDAYVSGAQQTSGNAYDSLTTREREVLQLAAQGHTAAEIAQRLIISPRTVETHRANLMQKLGLRSQAELIRFALQRGILK